MLSIYQKIDGAFTGQKSDALKLFARQFFASTSKSDLKKTSVDASYQELLEAWEFVAVRQSLTPKIVFVQHRVVQNSQLKPATSIFLLLKDMPFIVDSVRQGLSRVGVSINRINNAVIFARRRPTRQPASTSKPAGVGELSGKLQDLAVAAGAGYQPESVCRIHCQYLEDERCKEVEKELADVLRHVTAAVSDYPKMCARALAIRESLRAKSSQIPVSEEDLDESLKFIEWLVDNHFTFLGYEEYSIRKTIHDSYVELHKESMLGVSQFKT